jgi:hypothetical protein
MAERSSSDAVSHATACTEVARASIFLQLGRLFGLKLTNCSFCPGPRVRFHAKSGESTAALALSTETQVSYRCTPPH